jgi:hypothetical protein
MSMLLSPNEPPRPYMGRGAAHSFRLNSGDESLHYPEDDSRKGYQCSNENDRVSSYKRDNLGHLGNESSKETGQRRQKISHSIRCGQLTYLLPIRIITNPSFAQKRKNETRPRTSTNNQAENRAKTVENASIQEL